MNTKVIGHVDLVGLGKRPVIAMEKNVPYLAYENGELVERTYDTVYVLKDKATKRGRNTTFTLGHYFEYQHVTNPASVLGYYPK